MNGTRIAVLAKLPRAGLAKTRLVPALGAEGAAALAERLLRHTLREAVQAEVGPVELCLAPTHLDPLASELAARHGVALASQCAGDLGARLLDALTRGLDHHPAVMLIGTDAPALGAARLSEAAAALRHADAVIVPAADGGYALLGLKQPIAAAFVDMPWSTSQVGAMTIERLQAAGLTVTALAPVHDIDTPEDLCHLPAGWIDSAR